MYCQNTQTVVSQTVPAYISYLIPAPVTLYLFYYSSEIICERKGK